MQPWSNSDDGRARLQLDRFSAVVDPQNPARGLAEARADDQDLSGFHPLGVEFSTARPRHSQSDVERYVRGGDLVVTYYDRPAADVRAQIYWRADAHQHDAALAAVELLASVQTSKLDSFPQLGVCTQLVASEAYRLADAARGAFTRIVPPSQDAAADDSPAAPPCFLFRLPGRQFSYAQMVHPVEGPQSQWDGWLHGVDYRMQLRHELFARPLEKGVILRSRVLGVLLDRKDDRQAAAAHWTSFLHEALPLTT